MSRNRRILMQMAGLIETPWERMQRRVIRQQQKKQRDLERDLAFVDMIGRREKGDANLKPMPFAKQEETK